MPSMFSRRRAASVNPSIDRNTTAAAATAASSAFLSRAQSQSDLSSAAAAAALRSHTTSPEPVGNIQTKRMVRRGSQSSVASGSIVGSGLRGGVGRGGLSRNNSNGSMSDRTFRSPSPGRSNGAIPAAQGAPPVPALPASMRGSHHRSASTEPPQRMMSPTPRGKNRGVSVDRAGSVLANSSRRNTRLSDVAETVERQGSTGSINYSRPMSGIGHSPTAAPKATKANGSWFTAPTGTLSEKPPARPATADGYRSQDARNVQADIAAAANRPTKKKQIAQSTQGSHLARANEPSLSSSDEPPVMVYDPASRTFVARARPAAAHQQPPSPTIPTPAGPKPGEYDPSTRKIVPAIPSQQPSTIVKAGDSPARRAKPAAVAVNTQVQPPLRSPARSDTSGSPVSPRAAGILSKQPSMVREDPEGEQEAETITATKLNTKRTNGFSGFSKTTMRSASVTPASPIRTRNRSESLDVPNSGSGSSSRARGNSHSPSRSAHFSASPIVGFTRHDPPERGVSPAKSAMKHSPGSSLRGTSPMNLGASPASKAMSDTSDTPSVDGSGKKKKKSVRVSFTDQAPNTEPPVTPAFRAAAARKVSPLIDDDMEEIMKPRPDLPSFGSVRPSRVQQEVAEKVTERPPDRREPSSDRAIGGVLSHDAAKFKSSSNPVPPEVTSKDRPSYSSDESEDEVTTASELNAGDATAKAVSSQVVGSVPPPLDLEKEESDVSNIKISLQPPTPGEDNTTFEEAVRAESPPPRSSLEKFVVPGGWAPDADDNVSKPAPATIETPSSKVKSAPDNAVVPASQSEDDAGYAPPEVQLSDIAESDSDDSAVFSDAEEDLSYMDESGFASMDAIVESPVVKAKKETGPESPSLRQAARRTSKEESRAPPDDWSHATQYWKQLSKQQREQIERSHLSSDDEFAPTANSLANRPKKKKSAMKQSAPVEPVAYTMPAQPAKTAMRKSMRGPPEPAPTTTNPVHMRSSLREGGGGGMRTSMRDRPQSEYTASKPAERHNHRATSSGSNLPFAAAAGAAMSRRPQSPDEISQDGPFPKMEQRQQQAQTNTRLAKKVPPPPAPANDSDSESSFKKKRRPSQSNMDASGRYAMKRSMRAGSFDDSQHQQRPISPLPPASRKAFSVRSLSPTGSFFGRKQLKESMRAPPADSGVRTLRGPNSMGGKTAKAQRKPPPAPRQTASTSNMASKFKSKFADSDDSDDDDRSRGQKPSFFRSRFADSDDDEPNSRAVIPADLTPVRGIPRRRDQQDGDSTDLSDEDEDDPRKASRGRNKQSRPTVPDPSDVEKAMEAARRNLGMTNGSTAPPVNEGSALSKGSLRKAGPERPLSPANEDSPKKRGFMGSILRRSRTYSNTSQKPPMASPPPPLPTNFTPASPRPGKLQRRTSTATQDRDYFNNNNPKTIHEDGDANWPLSPPGRLGELRPSTSDGVSRHEQAVLLARQMRPDIGRSQSNSEGAIITGGHVGFADESNGMNGKQNGYGPKTGKKKKFGMLRRAFRLDD